MESSQKLTFEMQESTKLELLRVRKTPFRKLLRRYEVRETSF